MALEDEIRNAIGAHGMWKERLNAAIATGSSEFTPENVRVDNRCELGRWLYGEGLTVAEKRSPHYSTVRVKHAEFHKEAANVLALAVEGKPDEARKRIAQGSTFASLSANLTAAMVNWSRAVKAGL